MLFPPPTTEHVEAALFAGGPPDEAALLPSLLYAAVDLQGEVQGAGHSLTHVGWIAWTNRGSAGWRRPGVNAQV
jgi:hypothetical protein